MAVTPELQRELLRKDLETKMRADAEVVFGGKLDAEKNRILLEDLNKVFLYRENWLQRMRELRKLRNNGLFTAQDETELTTMIDTKLRANPRCIAVDNAQYGSDPAADVAEPSDATGFNGALKGIFSKITGALGDGPFAFIGKLLQQIFSFIFPMISAFKEMGEKLNPKPTPADLLKDGLLDEADAELANQEAELIQKLKALEDKDLTDLLEGYQKELRELEEVILADGTKLPFTQATEDYKRNTLRLRLDMFNNFSSKAAPALAAHAEEVSAKQQAALKEQQLRALRVQHDAVVRVERTSLEGAVLNARMQAIDAHQKEQVEKARLAAQRVTDCVHNPADGSLKFKAISDVHTPLWAAEQAKQKALATKARQEARVAKQRERAAYDRQLALAKAQRPAPVAADGN